MNIPFLSPGGTLNILTDKVEFSPGEKIRGRIELRTNANARAFTLRLVGYEFVHVSCGSGKHRRSLHEETVFFAKEFVFGSNMSYTTLTRDFEFDLPADAPRSFVGMGYGNAGLQWEIRAKLDVPMAMDMNASRKITVR